ncbi:hypothetical protein NOVOSPHI9U_310058 [Novosphingobium sp. 9U]|nr:hypothetical protein NOVOSPHI9U_310058 [Novosphingobium sp. 9U]
MGRCRALLAAHHARICPRDYAWCSTMDYAVVIPRGQKAEVAKGRRPAPKRLLGAESITFRIRLITCDVMFSAGGQRHRTVAEHDCCVL